MRVIRRGDSLDAIGVNDVVHAVDRVRVNHLNVGWVLTAREYALVEMLSLRRGKVVTRTELYDHLFAEEDQTLSNLLAAL